ncbi:MAG TPA: hypothetical protein VM513_31980 [Kofleriaceae bacterium]|nr:hypothetical protein [Kofleriaceae bacterium]
MLLACSRADEPEPVAADVCERGCAAAGSCLLAPAACVARCRGEPAIRACVDVASDCTVAARCFLAQTCGPHAPVGTGTCRSALDCMLACPERDLGCGCRCTERADPRHTLALARVGTCVVACDFAEPCIRARCAVAIQTCWLQ